ncbi:MAG: hypothetical protein LUD69_04665 [Oscillospiraceae bacterium]|nr:hypothetical protein [Oscillospiraceae bacterium]
MDAFRTKQKEAEVSEDRAIAEEIISNFDTMVREFLAANPDKSDEVKALISKYAKNANYKAIKEPKLAAKLVAEFKETFMPETANIKEE